jgi:DNA invertase Pin-like site-specific DNA recombinase
LTQASRIERLPQSSTNLKTKPIINLKTRQQLADEIGISRKTLYRWFKREKIVLPHGLICPDTEAYIKNKLLLGVSQNVP